jgi:hypothetical protein
LLKSGILFGAAGGLPPAGQEWVAAAEPQAGSPVSAGRRVDKDALQFRALLEVAWHPYSPLSGGSKMFFDKAAWERTFKNDAASGYNAVVYSLNPWPECCWQNLTTG